MSGEGGAKPGSRITIANTGVSFGCEPGEYILDAALRQGVALPHNCRGGACGACKADILEGAVEHGWVMSFAISDDEKAAGQCLACVSKPVGDRVTLSMHGPVAAAGDQTIRPAEWMVLVVASHLVTPAIRLLTLAFDRSNDFRFRPGMHADLGIEAGDGGRPYSIATLPGPDGRAPDDMITFYVTRQPDGRTSNWLHDHARPGARLRLRGPFGSFGAGDDPASGLLMLAGGSGLAPLLSIAGDRLRGGFAGPVELGLSVRGLADSFGLDALEVLARRHANFRYWVTLTRGALPEMTGAAPIDWRRGRVAAALCRQPGDLADHRLLIAGPPAFVAAAEAAARALAVPADRIEAESYMARPPLERVRQD